MKKLFCLVLCFFILLCATACGNSKKKNSNEIDIEYYAKTGKIPESEYALGADAEKIKKELSEEYDKFLNSEGGNDNHDHDSVEFFYQVNEDDEKVTIDNGTSCYYYLKKHEDKGIAYIVNYGTAFGLEMGTVITEVQKALGDLEFTQEELSEDNAFFATYLNNAAVLKGEFNGIVVLFVFQDNELYATAMYNSKNW